MGSPGSVWIAGFGLGILGSLTALGIIEASSLAAAGREVPAWLSQVIGGIAGNLALVIVLIFKGGGNGNGGTKPS